MKIQLPNPEDTSVPQWFAQMRIVLKSAEKMYEQMVKDLGEEMNDDNKPWVYIEPSDSWVQLKERGENFDLSEMMQQELCIWVDKP